MMNADKKLTKNANQPAVQASLQLLPLIMDNIPQAVFWKDQNLVYLGCNRAFAEDAGFASPEDVLGKTDFDMPWKDQAELYRADDRHVMDSGEAKLNYEEPQTTPTGSTIWLSTSKIPVYENNRVVAILGMYEDITERKQAELDLLLRDRALASSINAVIILDLPSNKPIYVNDALLKMTGYTFEEVKQLSLADITGSLVEPQKIREAVQTQGFFVGEELMKRKDGSTFPATFFTSLIRDAKGQPIAVQSSFFDISEHKQAEILQQQNERLFRALFEMSPDAVTLIDPYDPSGDWPIVDCNAATCQINGYTREELIGQPINIVNAPTNNPIDRTRYLETLRQGQNVKYEILHQRKNGEVFPVEVSTRMIKVGERELLLGIDRDITERKHLEEGLLLRDRALASSLNAVLIAGLDRRVMYVNDAFLKMFGYTYEEAMQITAEDLAGDEEIIRLAEEKVRTQGFFAGEYNAKRKDGTLISTYSSVSLIRNEEGQPIATQDTFVDITERKQAEARVQQEKSFSDAIINGLPGTFYLFDLQGKMLRWNKEYERVSGYTGEDMSRLGVIDTLAEEDREAALAAIQHALAEGHGATEATFITKDGRRIPYYFAGQRLEVDGQIYLAGTGMDLTERNQVEQALSESEERFKRFTEATVEGLVFHEQGRIVDVNPSALVMFGFLKESDVIGRNLLEFILPEFHPLVLEKMQLDNVPPYEIVCTRTDGSTFPVETLTRSYSTGNRVIRATSVRDITERKKLEEGLLLRDRALASSLNAVLIAGLDFQPIYVNETFLKMTGYTYEEAMQLPVTALSGYPEGLNRIDEATHTQGFFIGEEPIKRKDGSIFPTDFFTSYITDVKGQPIAIQTTFIDITQRKQLEQEIHTALERRGLQVQVSTQVSQSIAAASSLEELYKRVVTQVKEEFGYYHTQILRYDSAQEAVVLVTGYGEIGAKMLAAGHRMPMGEGLIGAAADTGQTVLRPTLENDPAWHPNPLLPETKGEIAVPIKLGDTVLGVLDVQSNVAGSLDADDQLLLEGLCGQIATAIESTRLRQEMAERLEEINRLYRAMSHEGWQTYRQTASIPSGFLYDQAGVRPAQEADLTEGHFANVPLMIPGGEVVGTLAVADDPQRPISLEDEDFLQQVSEQVALALESARLFEQTQAALSEVQRRASELETVATLSATTSSVLDPDQLLQTVVDLTKERFGLYHAHIYVYEESWNSLLIAAGAGEVGRRLVAEQHAIPITLEQSLVARAARERRAIIINDVESDPGFLPNPLLPRTCAEMAVPMTVGNKLLGVFDVQSDDPTGFSSEDANVYVTLAAQVGVALQNARLYMEQAALVTQLRELDRLKSSFLANMSHELRTPLNSILGFADVILEELDGPLTENMNNDLRLIQKNGQHLLHLINDVLDMAKIEAGRMNLNPENFKAFEVLEEVTSITSTLASEKNLALFIEQDSDCNVSIYADRTRLRQVMINLVNNAIKFTENGKIALKVASISGARVLITVKDTGIGIPIDKLEAIFQEFTQVDSSSTRKAGGTGLGLPISRRLVEMHGGRLWAESTGIPGEGSTFFVELPVEARMSETVERQAK